MEKTKYLTSLTRFYALALLHLEPRHGYEIITEIGEKLGKEPSAGQIYPMLDEFEEEGLVESWKEEIEGRERKVYELTESGEKTFEKLLGRFYELTNEVLDPWLRECAHCECQIFEGPSGVEVHEEEIGGKNFTFCCKHCAEAFKDSSD